MITPNAINCVFLVLRDSSIARFFAALPFFSGGILFLLTTNFSDILQYFYGIGTKGKIEQSSKNQLDYKTSDVTMKP
jgi:hypothetical protein